MVDPLVHDTQRARGREVDGQAVLGKDRQSEGRDELGDAVVDLRVDVVRPPREHDAASAALLHLCEQARALGADVGLGALLLVPRGPRRGAHLALGNLPLVAAEPDEPVGGGFLAGEGDKRADIAHVPVRDGLDVVADVLRVRDDDGTVEVVLRARRLLMLIEHTGVEDRADALIHEPLDMPVRELGGIALGLGRDGLHAQLIDPAVGKRREHHAEAQLPEKRRPIGVVFIEVQRPRDAQHAARGGVLLQRRIGKEPLALIGGHVRRGVGFSRGAEGLFAAVARDVPPPAGEGVDREHAVVFAAAAARGLRAVGQIEDLIEREHRRLLPAVVPPGEERRTERAHHARDVRAGDVRPGDLLERAQDGLVVERPTLHDDVMSQLLGGGELDDLIERVFDDGIGKARGDIRDGRALLLCLLDVGVHEHGAARAEVDGVPSEERRLREVLRRVAEGVGEVLDKRAAAGRARLVEHDAVDRAALETDALHVLPADVEHAIDRRVKKRGGGAVCDRLHLTLVEGEGRLEQRLAIARGAGADDLRARRERVAQRADTALGGLDGVSAVAGVERIEQLAALADKGELRRGGARVDAEEALAAVGREVTLGDGGAGVPRAERVVGRPIREQRGQARHLE